MKAKPCKCQCLAIEALTGTPDCKSSLSEKQPVRFLGGTIQVPNNPSLTKDKKLKAHLPVWIKLLSPENRNVNLGFAPGSPGI
jgi:hypothetical protein